MTQGRQPSTDLALIAVFAALIAALSLVPGLPIGPVPITLQTLGVALAGLILGPWRGFAATALYLVVGLAGLPVFAGATGGLGVLARPSVGYLLSFPIAALVAGFGAHAFTRRGARFATLFAAGIGASVLIIHPAGIAGLMAVLHLDLGAAFAIDVAFWPGDLVKNAVAAGVALTVHRTFPALAGRRLPATT